jgi:membrane protein YqaA with SNARE-associated domain
MAIFVSQSFARSLVAFFVTLGVFGPFLLETLDCSYLYLPLANELLLTALLARGDGGAAGGWWWLIYPLMSGAGAALGVFLLDLPARKAGEKGLKKIVDPKKLKWFTARLKKHAWLAVFVASFMPPPFPFRASIVAASALQTPRAPMLAGVFFGRWLRYTVESLLIVYFGRRLVAAMDSRAFDYVIYGLTGVAVVGSLVFIRKWFKRSK